MQENSNINIHNYEEYIVNYLDGKLNPVEAAELFLFLEIHAELDEDVDELREMTIEPDLNIAYDFKDALKLSHDADASQISSENYLYYFTAFIEGDLSQKGVDGVNYFIAQNPDYRNELLLLEKCKIEPAKDIYYPNKSKLKKKAGLIIPMPVRWAALAASLLILFTVYIRLEPTIIEPDNKTITKIETPVQKEAVAESVQTIPEEKITGTDKQASSKHEEKRQIANADTKQTQPLKSIEEERGSTITALSSLKYTNNDTQPFDASLRQTFSSLFEDISLSQQLMLAYAENHTDENLRNEYRPGINVGRRFNQYLQSGTQVASQVSESFSGWMLADIGLKGINLLTDKDLRLVREVQPNGATGDVILKSDDAAYFLKRADN